MSRRFAQLAHLAAGVATGRLGWPPESFWAATPADLALALAVLLPGAGDGRPLSRAELQRMMERITDDG